MEITQTIDIKLSPHQVARMIMNEFNCEDQAELIYYLFCTMFDIDSLLQCDYISKEISEFDEYDHKHITDNMNELFSRIKDSYIDRLKTGE